MKAAHSISKKDSLPLLAKDQQQQQVATKRTETIAGAVPNDPANAMPNQPHLATANN